MTYSSYLSFVSLLVDVQLPGMNGDEAIKKIRNNPKTRNIPIVAVTVLSSDYAAKVLLDYGANRIVHKPLDGPKLMSAINALLTTCSA